MGRYETVMEGVRRRWIFSSWTRRKVSNDQDSDKTMSKPCHFRFVALQMLFLPDVGRLLLRESASMFCLILKTIIDSSVLPSGLLIRSEEFASKVNLFVSFWQGLEFNSTSTTTLGVSSRRNDHSLLILFIKYIYIYIYIFFFWGGEGMSLKLDKFEEIFTPNVYSKALAEEHFVFIFKTWAQNGPSSMLSSTPFGFWGPRRIKKSAVCL